MKIAELIEVLMEQERHYPGRDVEVEGSVERHYATYGDDESDEHPPTEVVVECRPVGRVRFDLKAAVLEVEEGGR